MQTTPTTLLSPWNASNLISWFLFLWTSRFRFWNYYGSLSNTRMRTIGLFKCHPQSPGHSRKGKRQDVGLLPITIFLGAGMCVCVHGGCRVDKGKTKLLHVQHELKRISFSAALCHRSQPRATLGSRSVWSGWASSDSTEQPAQQASRSTRDIMGAAVKCSEWNKAVFPKNR